jgi:acyl dehydratase
MKPPLLLADLPLGRAFAPLSFPVTAALVDAYCTALGDPDPIFLDDDAARRAGHPTRLAPPGLAGIYGRQAYLRDHSMPPGGVLAAQSMAFHAPAYVGDTLEVVARVVERSQRKGRDVVTIESTASRRGGERVTTVRVVALWPASPAMPAPSPAASRGPT